MSWNVRGWTSNNAIIREQFIYKLNPDILCISETHLLGGNTIKIENYFYLHNRKPIHRNAPKTFGGVGTFVIDTLFNIYDIVIIDGLQELSCQINLQVLHVLFIIVTWHHIHIFMAIKLQIFHTYNHRALYK